MRQDASSSTEASAAKAWAPHPCFGMKKVLPESFPGLGCAVCRAMARQLRRERRSSSMRPHSSVLNINTLPTSCNLSTIHNIRLGSQSPSVRIYTSSPLFLNEMLRICSNSQRAAGQPRCQPMPLLTKPGTQHVILSHYSLQPDSVCEHLRSTALNPTQRSSRLPDI